MKRKKPKYCLMLEHQVFHSISPNVWKPFTYQIWYWTKLPSLPVQVFPSPLNPVLHLQVNEPIVSVQLAFSSQLWLRSSHSLISKHENRYMSKKKFYSYLSSEIHCHENHQYNDIHSYLVYYGRMHNGCDICVIHFRIHRYLQEMVLFRTHVT